MELTNYQKENLKHHKYRHIGISMIEPYLNGYWSICLKFMPKWLSPNMITLWGLVTNMIPIMITLSTIGFDTSKNVPNLSLIWISWSLFVYQTLDAVDGKQARRLGVGSPLGELFDHGCDSISTFMVNLMAALAIIPRNYENILFIWSIAVLTCSFIFHWQSFVTGTAFFTALNVTEGQIGVILVCLLPVITNPDIFHTQIFGIPIMCIFLIPVILNLTYAIFVMLNRIVTQGVGKEGSSIANSSVISPGLSVISLIFSAYYISRYSIDNLVVNNFYAMSILFGFLFGKLSITMLVSLVTKSVFFPMDSCLILPFAMVINMFFGSPFNETVILYFAVILSCVNWLHYFISVCFEFSKALNIPILFF